MLSTSGNDGVVLETELDFILGEVAVDVQTNRLGDATLA